MNDTTDKKDSIEEIDVTDPEIYYYYRFKNVQGDKDCFYSRYSGVTSPTISMNSVIIASIDDYLDHDYYWECLIELLDQRKDAGLLNQCKESIKRNKDHIVSYNKKFTQNWDSNFPLDKILQLPATIYFFYDDNNIFYMPDCYKDPYYIIRIFMKGVSLFTNVIKSKNNNIPVNKADCQWSIFEQEVHYTHLPLLTGLRYKKEVDFSCCTFNGSVDFNGSTFEEKVYFHNVTFNDKAYFSYCTFNGSVNFNGSTFKDKVNFNGSTFEEKVYFNGSTFEEKVYFHNVTFNDKAYFSYCTFNGTINFNRSIFGTPIDQQQNKTNEETVDKTQFYNVTFNDKAYFMGVTFEGDVNFNDSDFKSKTYFDQDGDKNTEFKGKASFEAVSFKNLVSFYGTKFHKNMNFFRTNFNEVANFNNVTFQQAFNFSNAYINNIKFLGIQLGGTDKDEAKADLSNFKEYFDKIKSNSLIKTKAKYRAKSEDGSDEAITFSDFRRSCAIVKDSLDKESQKIDANKFYSLELLAYAKELSKSTISGFLQSIVLFFNKLSSNHGQSWLQALLWILAFGTISGLLYSDQHIYIKIVFSILLLFAFICFITKDSKNFVMLVMTAILICKLLCQTPFLHGFQIAIFPFYTEKDTALSVINCFGFCIIDDSSNESMVFTLIINLIKVINVYLLYQFVQAVRLNTRR